jgi:hypothetical protein
LAKDYLFMDRKSFKYFVLILLIVFLPMQSCRSASKAARAQKQYEKKSEQRKKEGEKALINAKKRHHKMQGKEGRKRMEQTRRKSQRLNKNKKEPFYIRWFAGSGRR